MGKVDLIRHIARKRMQSLQLGKSIQGNTDNIALFPFAKNHPLNDSTGRLSEDGLVLTHLTDFAPNNGIIDTARSAIQGPRDSVHFAVNHAVTSHALGSWDTKPFALIMPMAKTMKTKENKFFGGVAGDFYSRGPVRIPEGSIIVRKSSKIPAGRYKLQDAAELYGLRGCYLIEVAEETNTKTIVDKLIRKLGYKLKDTQYATYWGKKENKEAFQEFNRFNTFLKEHNMKPALHSYTPDGKIDMLISHLQCLDKFGKSWLIKYGDDVLFDYKKEYLKAINKIEKLSRQTGYTCYIDLDKLKKFVKEAKTPKEACEILKKEMNISGVMIRPGGNLKTLTTLSSMEQDISGLAMFQQFVGGKPINVQKYLNIPNKTNLEEIEEADLENALSLFEIGAKFEKYIQLDTLI